MRRWNETIRWIDPDTGDAFSVTVRVFPGESAVRYHADGSGYPGSPDEFELVDIRPANLELAERLDDPDELAQFVRDYR